MHSLCRGLSPEEARRILRDAGSPEESIGYWVAAVRELFEEAGILLAYDHNGHLLSTDDVINQETFKAYRNALHKKELTLAQTVRRATLFLALDQLHYYAHWITPEARPERFDTRFFLARHPSGQEATHDQRETIAGMWLSPREALDKNLNREVVLSPPTLKTLEDLSRFNSITQAITSLKGKEIRHILPVLTKNASGSILLFPWDADYDLFSKKEVPIVLEHGFPSGPKDNTSRLLMKEGRWLPYCLTR